MKIAEKCENFSSSRPQTPAFSRSVCLFDSGIGGLNVLFACRRILPDEKFVYYGDNERAPYGNLPEEAVKAYVYEAAETLAEYHPKALVLACNTATAHCARALRNMYPFPVIGSYPPLLAAGKHGGEGLFSLRAPRIPANFSPLFCAVPAHCIPPYVFCLIPATILRQRSKIRTAGETRNYTLPACLPANFLSLCWGARITLTRKKRLPIFTAAPYTTGTRERRGALPVFSPPAAERAVRIRLMTSVRKKALPA